MKTWLAVNKSPQFGGPKRPFLGLPFSGGDGGMKSSASTASLDSERLPPIASKRKPGGRFWLLGWDGLG